MSRPSVSIVVPTFNRPWQLEACVRALAGLVYSQEALEIIVVDDGSQPPVAASPQYRLIRQRNAGPASARNLGAREATGELLAFLDDDCRPHTDWLSRLTAAWRPGRMVGGYARNAVVADPYAHFNEGLVEAVTEWLAARNHPLQFLTTSNLLVEARAFHDMGGFSTAFPLAGGEDREFSARWRDAGGELALEPSAVVDHHHGQTLRRFAAMHFRYGRGAAVLHRLRGTVASPANNLGLYAHLWRRTRSPLLLPLSQLATAAGYYWETRKRARS